MFCVKLTQIETFIHACTNVYTLLLNGQNFAAQLVNSFCTLLLIYHIQQTLNGAKYRKSVNEELNLMQTDVFMFCNTTKLLSDDTTKRVQQTLMYKKFIAMYKSIHIKNLHQRKDRTSDLLIF